MALGLALFGVLVYLLAAHSVAADQDRTLPPARGGRGAGGADRRRPATCSLASCRRGGTCAQRGLFWSCWTAAGGDLQHGNARRRAPRVPAPRSGDRPSTGGTYAGTGRQAGPALRLYVQPGCAPPMAGRGSWWRQAARVPAASLGGLVGFLVVSAVPSLLAPWSRAGWWRAGPPPASAGWPGRLTWSGAPVTSPAPPAPAGRDEIALLTISFNRMLDRSRRPTSGWPPAGGQSAARRRRLPRAADAADRDPGHAGLLAFGPRSRRRCSGRGPRHRDGERAHGRLWSGLLVLARADAGLRLERRRRGARRPGAGGVPPGAPHAIRGSSSTTGVEMAWVAGDSDTLRQLLWILLDNRGSHPDSARWR